MYYLCRKKEGRKKEFSERAIHKITMARCGKHTYARRPPTASMVCYYYTEAGGRSKAKPKGREIAYEDEEDTCLVVYLVHNSSISSFQPTQDK